MTKEKMTKWIVGNEKIEVPLSDIEKSGWSLLCEACGTYYSMDDRSDGCPNGCDEEDE